MGPKRVNIERRKSNIQKSVGDNVSNVDLNIRSGVANFEKRRQTQEFEPTHVTASWQSAANFPVSGIACGALPRRRYAGKVLKSFLQSS